MKFPRLILTILGSMLLVASANADDVQGRTGLGFDLGLMTLTGGDYHFENVDERFSLHLRHGLSSRFTLETGLSAGWLHPGVASPAEDGSFSRGKALDLYTVIWAPQLGVRYNFRPEKRLVPFCGLGLGVTDIRVKDMRATEDFGGLFPGGPVAQGYDENGEQVELHSTDFTADLSAGLEYFVQPDISLDLTARYSLFPGNEIDNVGLSSPDLYGAHYADVNTGLAEVSLGFTWFFGSSDSDGDGIDDKHDACPDMAEDFDLFEDTDGCPDPDNDGDGILDGDDGCASTAEDKDGFEDSDGCPDLDNDGDGIADDSDGCPNLAEDMDGFEDSDGCPDLDNDDDGVADTVDDCPATPAGVAVDENGCPVVEEIRSELILEGVNFKSGSDELSPESAAVLDRVAESLLAWPEVRIEVQGHTDSQGSAPHNLKLSQLRAESVRDYLVERSVAADRITPHGIGEEKPLADNATAEGRAANRRVEIHPVTR